jgi:hypothetical protein
MVNEPTLLLLPLGLARSSFLNLSTHMSWYCSRGIYESSVVQSATKFSSIRIDACGFVGYFVSSLVPLDWLDGDRVVVFGKEGDRVSLQC